MIMARTPGEKTAQASRTRANKKKKYEKLLEKFPSDKQCENWRNKLNNVK